LHIHHTVDVSSSRVATPSSIPVDIFCPDFGRMRGFEI
jgi:hypothetical protein